MDDLTPTGITGRGTRLPMVAGYLATVKSHLGAIVVLAIIGAVAGGALARQVPASFKANAYIELPDVPTYVDIDPAPPSPQRTTIDTTSELVFSTRVYKAVASVTGLSETKAQHGLSVSAYPLSRVLIVTFTARNRDLAVAGANAAATTVSAERASTLAGAQTQEAKRLSKRLEQLRDRSRNKVREFSPQTQELTNQILQLQDAIDAGADAAGHIINRADLQSVKRVKKHPELQVVTGVMVGVLLGIGYSWWRRDKHLHHDPRIIGLVAKVRPRWRSGPRSPRPAPGPPSRPDHSHAHP